MWKAEVPTSHLIDCVGRLMSRKKLYYCFMRLIVGAICTHFFYIFPHKKISEVLTINKHSNKPNNDDALVNEAIRFKEVRLISQTGEQLGTVSGRDAYRVALNENLDLVCVAPNAKPPVCRIMDYGKYRYEQQRRAREAKKNQKVTVVKEIRLSPVIEAHDLNTKLKRAQQFLEKGDKVKLSIRFRGRMIVHADKGRKVMNDFAKELSEIAQIESRAKMDGRNMQLVLAPIKK